MRSSLAHLCVLDRASASARSSTSGRASRNAGTFDESVVAETLAEARRQRRLRRARRVVRPGRTRRCRAGRSGPLARGSGHLRPGGQGRAGAGPRAVRARSRPRVTRRAHRCLRRLVGRGRGGDQHRGVGLGSRHVVLVVGERTGPGRRGDQDRVGHRRGPRAVRARCRGGGRRRGRAGGAALRRPTGAVATAVDRARTRWMAAAILALAGGTLTGERVLKGRSPFGDRLGEAIASRCSPWSTTRPTGRRWPPTATTAKASPAGTTR